MPKKMMEGRLFVGRSGRPTLRWMDDVVADSDEDKAVVGEEERQRAMQIGC